MGFFIKIKFGAIFDRSKKRVWIRDIGHQIREAALWARISHIGAKRCLDRQIRNIGVEIGQIWKRFSGGQYFKEFLRRGSWKFSVWGFALFRDSGRLALTGKLLRARIRVFINPWDDEIIFGRDFGCVSDGHFWGHRPCDRPIKTGPG